MSEPVSQATLRIVKVFWGLSSSLAYKRHFPAIDWLQSYSLYDERLKPWYDSRVGEDFMKNRAFTMKVLQEEAELSEIVRLVGIDALSPADRVTMETAKIVREDYLHQNAFHETDTYTSLDKQDKMLEMIRTFYLSANEAVARGADIETVLSVPVRERIGRAKYLPETEADSIADIISEIKTEIANVAQEAE